MSGTLKKVRFIVAWKSYRVGDEITPNGSLRDWLVNGGYAAVVENSGVQKIVVEKSGAEQNKSPVDRQMKVPNKREQRGGGLI